LDDRKRREREKRYLDSLRKVGASHSRDVRDRAQHIPDQLFHYTSSDAFKSIIDSVSFWATDYRHMNDASEFLHGLQVFHDAINIIWERRVFSSRVDPQIFDVLRARLLDQLNLNKLRQRIFLVCFCEEPNLLSQWRGYKGRAGCSLSLGLTTKALATTLNASGNASFGRLKGVDEIKLVPVEYSRERQYEVAERLINDFLNVVDEALLPSRGVRLSYLVEMAVREIVVASVCHIVYFKNPHFSEEREWRLIATCQEENVSPGFRPSAFGLTPYLVLPVGVGRSRGGIKGKIPLKTVYVGPNSYSALAAEAVKDYLLKQGHYRYCSVIDSRIPLRSL
jgi:hypothetical protein